MSPRTAGSRLLVLGYHNVEATWRWPARPGDGPRNFARQMALLSRVATVVPLDRALADLAAGRPLPPRAVAITFDDGYRDNLTHAVPVLRRLGLPATVFLVPGFLSHKVHAWWERLSWALRSTGAPAVQFEGATLALADDAGRARALAVIEASLKLDDLRTRHERLDRLVDALDPEGELHPGDLYMDWDEARTLVAAGVAIGSHTMNHAILAREPAAEQQADLRESRELLERELGAAVRTLAYPNGQAGDYDGTTIAAARAAGYTHAVTTRGRLTDATTPHHEIARWVVTPTKPAARLAVGSLRSLLGRT
ncbi:MAG: polysaccharide deacetylase family protein [Pseudonocardia sp.]